MPKFKQVSTGLILEPKRDDVVKQFEKYPDLYQPITENKPSNSSDKK